MAMATHPMRRPTSNTCSIDKSSSSSLASTDRPTAALSEDGTAPAGSIVGTTTLHAARQYDRRDKDLIVPYEPSDKWYTLPLRSWAFDLNRDVLAALVIWNVTVALLARYTSLCGPPPPDAPAHVLCDLDDEWLMAEAAVINTLGVGMFLLLAFRAHEGYDRFWEGRKAWGRVRECCRDLTRQICYSVSIDAFGPNNDEDVKERRRAVGFVGAFASTLKLTLRRERNPVPELAAILCFQDILNIEKANVMPLFCMDVLSYYLEQRRRRGELGEYTLGIMTTTCLSPLIDQMGTCERIRNQPIPLSYTLHLRFILILWLVLYPLHLVSSYGWYAILLASLVDFAVLGIESMACEIENPFGYHKNCIDLCTYCKGIVSDTQEILARAEHRDARLVLDGTEVRRANDCLFCEAAKDPKDRVELEKMSDPEENFFRKE